MCLSLWPLVDPHEMTIDPDAVEILLDFQDEIEPGGVTEISGRNSAGGRPRESSRTVISGRCGFVTEIAIADRIVRWCHRDQRSEFSRREAQRELGFLGDVTGQMIDMPSELPRLLER